MHASVSVSTKSFFKRAYLAATCFFNSSIPVSSLFLSFGRLWNMDCNSLHFFTVPSKKAPEKEPNDIAPLLSNKHDTLFQNSLSSRTKNSFAVVVNIYLAFFHIKSGNICERFSPLTSSNMNKVIMTTCNFPSEFLALSDYAQRHQC